MHWFKMTYCPFKCSSLTIKTSNTHEEKAARMDPTATTYLQHLADLLKTPLSVVHKRHEKSNMACRGKLFINQNSGYVDDLGLSG